MKPGKVTEKNENVKGQDGQKPSPNEPLKVMLADDDKDDQEIFSEALKESEVESELTTVNNGQELLENLKDASEPNPDIIFIDINMPIKNGKDALDEIKSEATLKDIPTVILSTSTNEKEIDQTFKAGANLYVQKPSSFSNFIKILKKVFALKWAGALFRPLRKTFLLSERSLEAKEKKISQ